MGRLRKHLLSVFVVMTLCLGVEAQDFWDVDCGGERDRKEKKDIKGFVPTFRTPPPFTPWRFFAIQCRDRGLEFHLVGVEDAYLIQRRINDTLRAVLSPIPDTLSVHDVLGDTIELFITIAPELAARFDQPIDTAHVRIIVPYSGALTCEQVRATWFLTVNEPARLTLDADLCVRFADCTPARFREHLQELKRIEGATVADSDIRPDWYVIEAESGCRIAYLETIPLGRRRHGIMNPKTGEGYAFLRDAGAAEVLAIGELVASDVLVLCASTDRRDQTNDAEE